MPTWKLRRGYYLLPIRLSRFVLPTQCNYRAPGHFVSRPPPPEQIRRISDLLAPGAIYLYGAQLSSPVPHRSAPVTRSFKFYIRVCHALTIFSVFPGVEKPAELRPENLERDKRYPLLSVLRNTYRERRKGRFSVFPIKISTAHVSPTPNRNFPFKYRL